MQPEEARLLKQQVKVSRMLADGFIFSIVWLGGIGSLIALIKGLQALRIIRQSNNEITGVSMALWCIITGALGTVILPIIGFLHVAYLK
jgi:hypothetical protein